MRRVATESQIQKQLYRWCFKKKHFLFCDNVYLFGWESDLVTFKQGGICYEFEIKRTRSDFRADKKKVEKHKLIQHYWELSAQRSKPKTSSVPTYFYYVVPKGLVTKAEVPAYAGLIYGTDMHSSRSCKFTTIKSSPRLNYQNLLNNQNVLKIAKSLSHRRFK